jgi:hypothetical protein
MKVRALRSSLVLAVVLGLASAGNLRGEMTPDQANKAAPAEAAQAAPEAAKDGTVMRVEGEIERIRGLTNNPCTYSWLLGEPACPTSAPSLSTTTARATSPRRPPLPRPRPPPRTVRTCEHVAS